MSRTVRLLAITCISLAPLGAFSQTVVVNRLPATLASEAVTEGVRRGLVLI